jgi:hypothetical protein
MRTDATNEHSVSGVEDCNLTVVEADENHRSTLPGCDTDAFDNALRHIKSDRWGAIESHNLRD